MHDNSPSLKASESEESKQTGKDNNNDENSRNQDSRAAEEEIDFEESQFQIPPSFSHLIMEETLHDNNRPYVFGHRSGS